jgi:hypothetical protein
VKVTRTAALPVRLTRIAGLGDLGIRAFYFLDRAGHELLKSGEIDLVYFSTTVFTTMALGRIWKSRYGTPYILDMQDPWVSDQHRCGPKSERLPKFWIADRVHRMLEPWTMEKVDGIVAVSSAYIQTLQKRYPRLCHVPTKTLPFGGAPSDIHFVRKHPQPNRFFKPGDGLLHGVYVGRGGPDMASAVRIIFGALRLGLEQRPEIFSRVRLHFIGTSYAPDGRARASIEPLAKEFDVMKHVNETTRRIPYFEALQLLLEADFLVVPGSDDPQYTASKIYPYILAEKPLLAVFRESSSVCQVLRDTGASVPITVSSDLAYDQRSAFIAWMHLLARVPFRPATKWDEFHPYLAREITRQQCEVFNQVLIERREESIAANRRCSVESSS